MFQLQSRVTLLRRPEPASLAPAVLDVSHGSLIGADSAAPAENKNPDVPLLGATDTSTSSRGIN